MACPTCGCKEVHQYDDEDDPQDDRLQRCAACGEIFDLDDHADEDDAASELLQHSSKAVTRKHYVTRATNLKPVR